MLRIRFGKLAIAVLAASGAAAHADMLDYFSDCKVTGRVTPLPWIHEGKSLKANFTTPVKEANFHEINFESPALLSLGSFRLSAQLSGEQFSGPNKSLFNGSSKTIRQTAREGGDFDAFKDFNANGFMVGLSAKGTIDWNSSLYFLGQGGVGYINPIANGKDQCGTFNFGGGFGYRINPSLAIEFMGKHTGAFNGSVSSVSVMNIGLNWTFRPTLPAIMIL